MRYNARNRALDRLIEKVTYLSSKGKGSEKFRKGNELYYLMNKIKK